MFILQPAYDPPKSEIEQGTYIEVEVDTENSYLQKQKDGSYIYFDSMGENYPIDSVAAGYLIEMGVPVKE